MFNLVEMLRPMLPLFVKVGLVFAACKALKYCIKLHKSYRRGRGI